MDGWGALTMLIKRQQADKFRKAALRAKLKSQKESYIHSHESKDEFNFPELPRSEMEKLKSEIRRDFKKQRIKQNLYYTAILITILTFFYFFFIHKHG